MHTDADFMRLALAQSALAADADEVPVGAVVVKDGVVIGVGRNNPVASHDPSAHAEIMALRAAAATLGNYRLEGCELFVTLEPCPMCAGAILHARLQRVIFGAHDTKTGAAGSVVNLFENPQLNHHTQVCSGVLQEACAQPLQQFFKTKRARHALTHAPLREDALRTPSRHFADLSDYPWQAHYANNLPALAGLRMHYVDEGATDAPLVCLCIHSDTTWGYAFRGQIAPWLASGIRVLAVDLIGFGKSDKPKRTHAHTLALHLQSVQQLIVQLDLRHVVLVLEKNTFAAALCQMMPDRILGLIHLTEHMDAADHAAYSAPFPDTGHRAAIGMLRHFDVADLSCSAPVRVIRTPSDLLSAPHYFKSLP